MNLFLGDHVPESRCPVGRLLGDLDSSLCTSEDLEHAMELDESMIQVLTKQKHKFHKMSDQSLSLLFSGSHLLKFEWISLLFWRFKSVASEVWSYVAHLYIPKKLDFIQHYKHLCSLWHHHCNRSLDLFSELPYLIIVGDFNVHNSMRGSTRICQKCKLLEQLLIDNFVTLNTGEISHIYVYFKDKRD